jgi:hypothetical protein
MGYPWTYHQFHVIALRRRYNLTRPREKDREREGRRADGKKEERERRKEGTRKRERGTYEIGSSVNWAIISSIAGSGRTKLTRL